MAELRSFRLEDLRRYIVGLATGLSVAPARASTLASLLLWFDAAGAPSSGIATLPELLDSLENGTVRPVSEGIVTSEQTGAASLDGLLGVPLLILEHAARIASEKAREGGVGLVRVSNIGPVRSAASVAAEIGVGPMAGWLVGPGASWAAALSGAGEMPTVFDPSLARVEPKGKAAARNAPPARPAPEALEVLASLLAGEGGWLVGAFAVKSWESLEAFHERLGGRLETIARAEGLLDGATLESRRDAARTHGIAVAPSSSAWKALRKWGERIGLTPPEPIPNDSPKTPR